MTQAELQSPEGLQKLLHEIGEAEPRQQVGTSLISSPTLGSEMTKRCMQGDRLKALKEAILPSQPDALKVSV